MDLREQVTLRVAAANFHQARQRRAKFVDGFGVTALGVGHQSASGRQADPGPYVVHHGIVRGRRGRGCYAQAMRFQAAQQGVGLGAASACQAVQVLQVQKREHMVMHPGHQVVRHILPAISNLNTGEFQSRQQRDGADLVLRIFLDHAPDLFVVHTQHIPIVSQFQCKQRQVPPVVRDHEGVQPGPGGAAVPHKRQAFGEAPLGQHHVRQSVLCPRFLGTHGDGLARRRFGLRQQMALFPAKRRHAVYIRHVSRMGQGSQCQAQHAGRVALVEQMVLAELEGHEIARIFPGQLLVQADGTGNVAVHPRGDCGCKTLFTRAGGRRVGQGRRDEGTRVRGRVGRLGEHVQGSAIRLHDGAAVARANVQDVHRPCFAGDKTFDEIVHRRQAGWVLQMDRVAQAVGGHLLLQRRVAALAAGGEGHGFCGPRTSSKARATCNTPRSSKRWPAICRPIGKPVVA